MAALVLIATGTAAPAGASGGPAASSAFDAHLTRAPYLTDLVGLHVAVNFATDQSGQSAGVSVGAVTGGACTTTGLVPAVRRTIKVGTVNEYQWTSQVSLPASGAYCYRVYLGSTDLLAGAASPQFTTQQQPGDLTPFSFDVMGDWGSVDATGQNAGQAALMQQIANSNARFLVAVGDNGYPDGSQINYGDLQQTGVKTSAVFGPQSWTVPGPTTPIFTAAGNHGLAGSAHTDITTWTQNTAVADSGGRYQDDVYCCVNNTRSTHYGSQWYSFTAGNARFYVLDAAWGDSNAGTATPYANDAAAHWTPGSPEYQWLVADLAAHPTQLKFAFFHYPLHVDNPTEASDTYLSGPDNLEGLLARNGVQMAFNGHAHLYQRNLPSSTGMPVSYVTGGGGGTPEPVGPCTAQDAYAVGWSPTKLKGSACGGAAPPTSASQVHHFLKVTVSGSQVTVAPTNALGQTFDVQTYQFTVPVNTWIDSGPPPTTASTRATLAFHASSSNATFTCTIDHGPAGTCMSPATYTGLGSGSHTFTVAATVNGVADLNPARRTWTVDATPPSTPTGFTASAQSSYEVALAWNPSTDDTGVIGYRIRRDGAVLKTTAGASTAYTDDAVAPGTTHSYTVTALDAVSNESPPSNPVTVTTSQRAVPVFADGFESGDLSAWNSSHGLLITGVSVHNGAHAAEGNTTTGATYAKKTLPSTYPDAYAAVAFNLVSQSAQVNLLRLRAANGASLGYAYVSSSGRLGVFVDATGTTKTGTLNVTQGWHALQLRLAVTSAPGTPTGAVQVWLDGVLVGDLSSTATDTGSTPVGAMQIGETQTGRSYDVVFDDAAFATDRLGTP